MLKLMALATPLGDPIEIAGLTQAFRLGTDGNGFCAIGSVKTNIGHLDVAAGVAGLIKTALALQAQEDSAQACTTKVPIRKLTSPTRPFTSMPS